MNRYPALILIIAGNQMMENMIGRQSCYKKWIVIGKLSKLFCPNGTIPDERRQQKYFFHRLFISVPDKSPSNATVGTKRTEKRAG